MLSFTVSRNLMERLTDALTSEDLANEFLQNVDDQTYPSQRVIDALAIATGSTTVAAEIAAQIVNVIDPPAGEELTFTGHITLADALADEAAAKELMDLF